MNFFVGLRVRKGNMAKPSAFVSATCLVCGTDTRGMNVRYPIMVDDGKKPGTPNRWRHAGYACDGHEDQAQRIAEANA